MPSRCRGATYWPCRLIVGGAIDELNEPRDTQAIGELLFGARVTTGLAGRPLAGCERANFRLPRWNTGEERENKSKKMSFPSSNKELSSLKVTSRRFGNYCERSELLRKWRQIRSPERERICLFSKCPQRSRAGPSLLRAGGPPSGPGMNALFPMALNSCHLA